MPIGIPRGEVHFGIAGIASQNLVDRTDALKKLRPIECGRQPHAHHDVTNRHTGGRLVLMLGMHHVVGSPTLQSQPFVEPSQHGTYLGV